jgi:hypothetical protein
MDLGAKIEKLILGYVKSGLKAIKLFAEYLPSS